MPFSRGTPLRRQGRGSKGGFVAPRLDFTGCFYDNYHPANRTNDLYVPKTGIPTINYISPQFFFSMQSGRFLIGATDEQRAYLLELLSKAFYCWYSDYTPFTKERSARE